ncbi:hypothetical protein [Hydrocarboniphaga sp.]|nr:hypothetical protein [Hydrocarboniphaga sp.]
MSNDNRISAVMSTEDVLAVTSGRHRSQQDAFSAAALAEGAATNAQDGR